MINLLKKLLKLDDKYYFYAIIFLFLLFCGFILFKKYYVAEKSNEALGGQLQPSQLTIENSRQSGKLSANLPGVDFNNQITNDISAQNLSIKDDAPTKVLSTPSTINSESLELEGNAPLDNLSSSNINRPSLYLDSELERKAESIFLNDNESSENSLSLDQPVENNLALSSGAQNLKDDSDVLADLETFKGYKSIKRFLIPKALLRSTVKSVYGISKGQLISAQRPINLPEGTFIADEVYNKPGSYVVGLKNYRRYDPYIWALTAVDTQALAKLYQKYALELEASYKTLESSDSNIKFFQVLISAIDVLLEAPPIDERAVLYSTATGYKFIDEKLEALATTSKIMVRMGDENSKQLKSWLSALKNDLEALPFANGN